MKKKNAIKLFSINFYFNSIPSTKIEMKFEL